MHSCRSIFPGQISSQRIKRQNQIRQKSRRVRAHRTEQKQNKDQKRNSVCVKVKLSPAIFLAHAKALESTNAKYPVRRIVCKSITIP